MQQSQQMDKSQLVVDPDAPSTHNDGVDRTLIRYSLRLTPGERLNLMCDWANSVMEMADAAAVRRNKDTGVLERS